MWRPDISDESASTRVPLPSSSVRHVRRFQRGEGTGGPRHCGDDCAVCGSRGAMVSSEDEVTFQVFGESRTVGSDLRPHSRLPWDVDKYLEKLEVPDSVLLLTWSLFTVLLAMLLIGAVVLKMACPRWWNKYVTDQDINGVIFLVLDLIFYVGIWPLIDRKRFAKALGMNE